MRYAGGALFLILGTPPPLSITIGQPTRAPDLGQLHYKPTPDQYQPRPEYRLTRERVQFRLCGIMHCHWSASNYIAGPGIVGLSEFQGAFGYSQRAGWYRLSLCHSQALTKRHHVQRSSRITRTQGRPQVLFLTENLVLVTLLNLTKGRPIAYR